MAHELAYSPAGVAQTFSTRLTPWHREGRVLAEAPDFDAALEFAGHRFDVEVRPAYRQILAGGAVDYVESRHARVTVRTDTGAELGAVGTAYRPIQNADAFAPLRPLVDAGAAQLETGGTLRQGADVWLQVRFDLERFGPTAREVLGGEVVPFGLVANNHSGRRGCLLTLTPVRVVCANTLGTAEAGTGAGDVAEGRSVDGRAIVVRHTEGGAAKVAQAAGELFAALVERYEVVAAQYRALKRRTLRPEEFEAAVLDAVAPDPRRAPRFAPDARLAEVVVARAEAKRATLTRLWGAGDGHTGDGSAWEGYNAAVQALDHDADGLWPTRGGTFRTASLMHGTYGALKRLVLNRLLALAA